MAGEGQSGSPGRTRGITGGAARVWALLIGTNTATAPRLWSTALRGSSIVMISLTMENLLLAHFCLG